MKIAFVIVLYKTPQKEVLRLKREIRALRFKDCKLYLIDNTRNNRGYGKAANKGMELALENGSDLIVIANPDLSLKKIKNQDLLKASKRFDIWGFAMEQRGIKYYGGFIDPLRLSGWLRVMKPKTRFSEATWVSGSLMFIKRKVIEKIGFFDERFFMYYEDVDYCVRAGKAGFKVGIDSKILYEHYEWKRQNPNRAILIAKARNIFFKKHGNLGQKIYEFIRLPRTIWENLQK